MVCTMSARPRTARRRGAASLARDGAQNSRSPGLQTEGTEKKTGRGQNKNEECPDNNEVHAVSMPDAKRQHGTTEKSAKCKPPEYTDAAAIGAKRNPEAAQAASESFVPGKNPY